VKLSKWARDRWRPLLADASEGREAKPLQVTFNRIKTSTEVRRTRRLGGHLPSAAKSNTMQVLFRNYLGGDPVIVEPTRFSARRSSTPSRPPCAPTSRC